VIVTVDAELDPSSVDDVSQCEDTIVSQWREVSMDNQKQLRQQIDEILQPLGLQTKLVVIERANSIALSFICLTSSAVKSLRDKWRSGQLKQIVEPLFTFLSGVRFSGANHPVSSKRLTWSRDDYERSLEFFSSPKSKPTIFP